MKDPNPALLGLIRELLSPPSDPSKMQTDKDKVQVIREWICYASAPSPSILSAPSPDSCMNLPKLDLEGVCDASLEKKCEEKCDVHIFGAGPAGLFTALFLNKFVPTLTIKILESRKCSAAFDRKSLLLINPLLTNLTKFLKIFNTELQCVNCVRVGRLQRDISKYLLSEKVKRENISVDYETRVTPEDFEDRRGNQITVDATGGRLFGHKLSKEFRKTSILLAYVKPSTPEKAAHITRNFCNEKPSRYGPGVIELANKLKLPITVESGIGVYKYGNTSEDSYYYVLVSLQRGSLKLVKPTETCALANCEPNIQQAITTLLKMWLNDPELCIMNRESTRNTDLKAPRIIPDIPKEMSHLWADEHKIYKVGDSYSAPKWIFGEGLVQSILTAYANARLIVDQLKRKAETPDETSASDLKGFVENKRLHQDFRISTNTAPDKMMLALQEINRKMDILSKVMENEWT